MRYSIASRLKRQEGAHLLQGKEKGTAAVSAAVSFIAGSIIEVVLST